MAIDLTLLYRGRLSSCNYSCDYCPFDKAQDSRQTLLEDEGELERFVRWVSARAGQTSVFFTPWGEALIRRSYQRALVQLSWLPRLRRVAIQTNLSGKVDFLRDAAREKVALWCSYHPGQTTEDRFVAHCEELLSLGIAFSVGVVGLAHHQPAARSLRQRLPAHVYLWVNAYKREPDYYDARDLAAWEAIDPLFRLNQQRHASRGEACATGRSVVSVDGEGRVTRCHFVRESLGNLYEADFEARLRREPCPQAHCGCYIGYAHLERLRLGAIYGDGILERNAQPSQRDRALAAVRLPPLAVGRYGKGP